MTAPLTVTITGADDDVPVEALAELSAEFPFVEWGILASSSREGTPRFPSKAWMVRLLVRSLEEPSGMRLSLHLCGQRARSMRAGSPAKALEGLPSGAHPIYQRIQLNGFDPRSDDVADLSASGLWLPVGSEFILQARSVADLEPAAEIARRITSTRCSVLFDPSGGTGQGPDRWPAPPARTHFGWAGGIGPGNVETVLASVLARPKSPLRRWIDMESGVRRDDKFDLGLVREVLQRAAPAIREAA